MNCGAIASAEGEFRKRERDDCDRELRIEIENVPNGSYSVLVNGIDRGTINVVDGKGRIEFENTPNSDELPITFDPFGEIDIVRDATGQHILSESAGCTIP